MGRIPTLRRGTMEIRLTQADMAEAVQFWLNERVMQNPVIVEGMKQTTVNEWSTFMVEFKLDSLADCEEAHETELLTKAGTP